MKLKITTYWLLLFLLIPPLIHAQQTVTYFGLKDAVEYGLKHHFDIQKSDYEIDKYNQKFKEELAQYLPQITADAAYTNNLKLMTQIIPGEFLGQPGMDEAIQFGTKYNASANIDVTQTLIDFEKLTGQQIAKHNRKIGLLDKQKATEQIIYDIANAYNFSQVAFLQQCDITENLRKVDTLISNVTIQIESGFAKAIDLKRLQLERKNLQTALQNAEMEYEQSIMLLKYTMTHPLEETIRIDTQAEESTFTTVVREEFPIKSVDLQLLAAQGELTALSLKQMKQGYLPKLSFNFQYGTLAQQNSPNIFRGSTNWYPNSLASLNLSIPIFDGNYKAAKIKQLQLDQYQNELDIDKRKYELDKDVKKARAKLTNSYSNRFTTKESMLLAEEVYAIAYIQFENGYSSLKELLDTNSEVKEAQTRYLQAILDVQSAELELLNVSGNIETILK